ncbi:hypothetical protein [Ferroplasma sp.]|uniref:hypothetical protein n=1 Tax=Ferroplasma sp. TaxID=2591003 RepID=UPI002626455E|nr:hypothetical protein [Ferroplasma sp.]MCL4452974.1 hypothetical protein [Candidatus Thermoplasmatota archaeon]
MDELDKLRNNAIDFLFNVDIIEDCTYVNRDDFVPGGLEYDDLDYQDINMLFTVDDFTVLNLNGDRTRKLIINFNGIHGDDPENFDDIEFYKNKYRSVMERASNVSMINIIPLRTKEKQTFLNLFERTEFNGIVTFDFIIESLFRTYIVPVINIIKPEEVLVLDPMLSKSLKTIIDKDSNLQELPVKLYCGISEYTEETA